MSKQGPCVTNVEDMPHDMFDWGGITWLMNERICPGAQQTFGIVYIHAGTRNTMHSHPNCEELLYVLQGQCDHSLGDECHSLKAGDLIRIPAGTAHHATNTGWAPVVMVISYSSPNRLTDVAE
jgi:quercetin dioxygenase-like cupin family protein